MSLLHPASSDKGSTKVPEVLFVGLAWYATPLMKLYSIVSPIRHGRRAA